MTEATPERQVLQVYRDEKSFLPGLELDLAGIYQQYNLPGVLQALVILHEKGYRITHTSLRRGLASTKALTGLKGRWQVLSKSPLTICDTAHNEDGMEQVLKQLENLKPKQVHMVFGTVNDKDITSILTLLPRQYRYYFCQASIPRALPVQELLAKAQNVGLEGAGFRTVSEAVAAAKANAAPDEVIFIGGSTFVVAELEEL